MKFSKIYLKIGISDTQSFQSSGKFTCTEPGLYYISAYIRVSRRNSSFEMRKNNNIISQSATNDISGRYSTTSIFALTELNVQDTVYITVSGFTIEGQYSCMTIVKIK